MKALSPLRLLALPLLALAALPSCKRNSEARNDPDWWRLEGERVALAHEVDLLKLRSSGHEGSSGNYAAISAEVSKNADHLAELKAIADGLREDVASLAAVNAEQRETWLRATRAAAVGRSFVSLSGSHGRAYQDVVITKVTDIGIEFRHSTGSARLSAEDMSPEQHFAFGLDPDISDKALAKESASAKAYESWVDDRLVTVNAAKEANARFAEEQETERVSAIARARVSASQLAATETSKTRLRDEPRSFGSSYRYSRGNTTWYPSYYGCASRYYYVSPCYSRAVPYYRVGSKAGSLTKPSGCYTGSNATPVAPPVRATPSVTTPITSSYRTSGQ